MKKILLLLGAIALFVPATLFAAATKIACVGDSITYGYLIPDREENNYPKFLGELLGPNFEVRNFGNAGKTCGDYPSQKSRKRWLGDNVEHKAATDWQADVYICNLGINDTGAWWDGKLFADGYKHLVKDWRGKRGNVPLMMWTKLAPDFRGPLGKEAFPGNVFAPDFSFPLVDNGSSANRPEAQKILERVAKDLKAYPMDALSPLRAHPEFYLKDGLHPNAAGARRIAEFTFADLVNAKFPKVKIPQGKPQLRAGADGKSVILKNPGDVAVLLDDAWALSGDGGTFVFENATVIPPHGEISVALAGTEDRKDPASPLVSAKLKNAASVKLTEAPKRGGGKKR